MYPRKIKLEMDEAKLRMLVLALHAAIASEMQAVERLHTSVVKRHGKLIFAVPVANQCAYSKARRHLARWRDIRKLIVSALQKPTS